MNAKTVDATDSDSAGSWRELLDGAGVRQMSVSGDGAFRDAAADAIVRQAFFDQAAHTWRFGIAVTLYPFVMMDVPPLNGLPDPYGEAEQAAYPWRGRITGEVAPGLPGATDLTGAAASGVAAFFGDGAG